MDDDLEPLFQSSPNSQRDYSAIAFEQIVKRQRMITIRRWCAITTGFVIAVAVGWTIKPEMQCVIEKSIVESPNEPTTLVSQPLTADQLEQQAELSDDPAEVARYYRLAGDDYLKRSNYVEAERCYRQFVRTSKETQVRQTDSWLLQTVKHATPKGS